MYTKSGSRINTELPEARIHIANDGHEMRNYTKSDSETEQANCRK